MATTFVEALRSGESLEWRCYVTIDGLPHVFGVNAADTAVLEPAAGRVHLPVLAGPPTFGGDQLDYAQRRVIGGSFSVTLVDDAAGSLRQLFTPRRRRSTWLAATVDRSTAPFQMASTTWAPTTSTAFYVDGETVVGTKAGLFFTSITRGAFGSPIQPHRGGSEQGASVFITPPSWAGRRARVWAYLVDAQGRVTTARRMQLGTWRIKSAPVAVDKVRWRLEGEPLADDFGKRKIGEGLAENDCAVGTEADTAIIPYGPAQWMSSSTTYSALLLRHSGDYWTCATIDELAYLFGSVVIGPGTRLDGPGAPPPRDASDRSRTATARHLAMPHARGEPWQAVLRVLTSRVGDSVNGVHDVLPGYEPTTFGALGYRFGAGIEATEIDGASFQDAMIGAPPWSLVIDDSVPVGDFLADLALVCGAYWCTSRDGKLQLRRLGETRAGAVLTLDASNVRGMPTVEYDDANISPRIRLRCNYNAVTGEHDYTLDIVDEELARSYPGREDAIEIETRLLQVAPATPGPLGGLDLPTVTREQVETTLRRFQVANGRGRCLVSVDVNHEAARLAVGDVVRIGFDAHDLEGGSVIGRAGRVVKWKPDIERGVYVLTLEVLDTLYAVAPAARITAVSGVDPNFTVTLSTTAPENGGSTTPGLAFAVGMPATLLRMGSATPSSSTIQAVAATTVDLKTSPAPAVGDVLTIDAGAWVDTTSANAQGYVPADFTYLQANAPGSFVTRWR